MAEAVRVTISLSKDLVLFIDKVAEERKTNRSEVVSSCLQGAAKKQLEAELEEGYRAMAEEHRKMAELAFEAQREVVPEWKE